MKTPSGFAAHYATVPPVRLFWGCIERNSLVLMADGSERPICDVRPGDLVLAPAGSPVRVVDVLRGYEEELVRLDFSSGRSLLLTGSHPVATESGMKRADEVVLADRLCGGRGEAGGIVHHYAVPGHFEVCNLVLEGGDAFIAEGVAVGDNEAQGRLAKGTANRLRAEAPIELLQEIDRMRRDLPR